MSELVAGGVLVKEHALGVLIDDSQRGANGAAVGAANELRGDIVKVAQEAEVLSLCGSWGGEGKAKRCDGGSGVTAKGHRKAPF